MAPLFFLSLITNVIFFVFLLYYAHSHNLLAAVLRSRTPAVVAPNRNVDHMVRESLFERVVPPQPSRPIVFLGDSITQFCEWSELLGVPVLNRGIGGDTSNDVLSRLEPVLALHPKAIFLLIGTNDALFTGPNVAAYLRTYAEILNHVREGSPGTVVFIESIPPIAAASGWPVTMHLNGNAINSSIQSMNKGIEGLADGKSSIYLDIYDVVQQGGELNPRFSIDGVHLNALGYEALKQKILPIVESVQ